MFYHIFEGLHVGVIQRGCECIGEGIDDDDGDVGRLKTTFAVVLATFEN